MSHGRHRTGATGRSGDGTHDKHFMTFPGSFPFLPGKEIYASVRLAYIPLPIRHDRMEPETSL